MHRHSIVALASLLAGSLVARPLAAQVADSVRAPESPPAAYVPHRVYDVQAQRFTDFEAMVQALTQADVVLVGEQHDDPGTHRMEAAILDGLARRGRRVAVSLEMFERDVQGVVDGYLAGRLSETELLAQARPWPNYAADYRPLVEAARAHGWPVIAANVPRRVASRVAREGVGAVATLAPEERRWVAAELSCPTAADAYHAKFVAQMSGMPAHGSAPLSDSAQAAMVQRFYEAQCVKDETMGEAVAAAARALDGAGTVVHYNGAFHSDQGLGAAQRAAVRLPGRRVVVVSAMPVADLDTIDVAAVADRGDYLLFTLAP
ncbi:MAG TPA: ChaN family lipoprotein [Gemmatimonadaceae bacterium]|nr:ChaN family lipoprotein [Gemmatimonadaceae bacterium]